MGTGVSLQLTSNFCGVQRVVRAQKRRIVNWRRRLRAVRPLTQPRRREPAAVRRRVGHGGGLQDGTDERTSLQHLLRHRL